jgi:hypothetical protein|tara:strand:- start:12 stop:200 length:189 start_codon:yes stop_codon:yes gene_type:complete
MEPDLNKAMEGLKTYHYIQKVIKLGGGKYKQIHRRSFEAWMDETKGPRHGALRSLWAPVDKK